MDTEKLVELAALILLVGIFMFWEKRSPARNVNHRVSKFDLLVVLNLSLFSLLCKTLIPYDAYWTSLAPFAKINSVLRYGGAVLSIDFILYWVHRFMHHRLLWKSHRFHHTPRELNWLTGLYTSGTHIAMYVIPQLLICFYIFGFTRVEMLIVVVLSYFVQFWQHANIDIDGGFLKYIFVTPSSHRVHHASGAKTFNTNFGAVFSFWDVLFGTYHHPTKDKYPLGVARRSSLFRNLVGY